MTSGVSDSSGRMTPTGVQRCSSNPPCIISFASSGPERVRQARARPLLDELHRWLNKILAGLSRKSDTALAIRYALSRWRALSRYIDDGRIEIADLNEAAAVADAYACSGTDIAGCRQLWEAEKEVLLCDPPT
jgi:hypothetical protein